MKNLEEHYRSLDLDNAIPPAGHQARFMERLENAEPGATSASQSSLPWYGKLALAASVILVFGLGMGMLTSDPMQDTLAQVAPQMQWTQDFFVTSIEDDLAALGSMSTHPGTPRLITDGQKQLDRLEQDYNKLTGLLKSRGYNPEVVSAIFENYNQRKAVLVAVQEQIEELNNISYASTTI